MLHLRERPAPAEPVQFGITAEEQSTFVSPADFAIAPDGRHVVFVALNTRGESTQPRAMLWVRPLASGASRVLPGTEGASFPFWSPDSRYIGFFANANLKKVDVSGTPPVTMSSAPGLSAGGTWNRNNVIVFSSVGLSGLQRIDAAGGPPTPLTNVGKVTARDRWPSFLPGDRHVVYLAVDGNSRDLRILALDSPETPSSLGTADSNAVYAAGHLLFMRSGTLLAQPFDAAARRTSGDPFQIAEQVTVNGSARAAVSVSETGALAFWRGTGQALSTLTWVDRAGKTTHGWRGRRLRQSQPEPRRTAACRGHDGRNPSQPGYLGDRSRERRYGLPADVQRLSRRRSHLVP